MNLRSVEQKVYGAINSYSKFESLSYLVDTHLYGKLSNEAYYAVFNYWSFIGGGGNFVVNNTERVLRRSFNTDRTTDEHR